MKKYYFYLLFIALFSTCTSMAVIIHFKFIARQAAYYGALEEHQFSKLKSQKDIDTIFVGDSSLGNAIDTATFDIVAGTKSINLALTGIYGYAGSYNMIKRSLDEYNVKNIIIMHTLDLLSRKVDYRAFLLTSNDFLDKRLPTSTHLKVLRALTLEALDRKALKSAFSLILLGSTSPANTSKIENDYHPQGPPLTQQGADVALTNDSITARVDLGQVEFLRLIANVCKEKKLNCLYSFGPIFKPIFQNSRLMHDLSTEIISATGIPLITESPYLMTNSELGDSIDHVSPSHKSLVTKSYAKNFTNHLQ